MAKPAPGAHNALALRIASVNFVSLTMNIQEIGEQGLLKIVQRFCPSEVVGDDAAILTPTPGQSLVVTTDMLIDGVHFSDRTTSAEDTGWRAAATNLSDLAAMGATPVGITVALGVTGDTPVDWVEQLYQGLSQCLNQFQTSILGGDICRSPVRSVSITALGEVDPAFTLRRNAAQPGYAIVATGVHGNSRAGLELLLKPELAATLTPAQQLSLIQAHQRPQPRLDVIPVLQNILVASDATVTVAGMDSSDGLADAIHQICQASGVGAKVESRQIPISPTLQHLVSPEKALEWALYGGEDFELVLCVPADIAQQLVTLLPTGAAILGVITADTSILLVNHTKPTPEEKLTLSQGFQHFPSGDLATKPLPE